MIIEFIGLMGVGKTTLYQMTIDRLRAHGRAVWTPSMLDEQRGKGRLWRLVSKMRASWESPAVVALAIRHLFASGRSWDDKLRGCRWFFTSLGNRWRSRVTLAPGEIAVIDEGLGQRMLNLFVHDAGAVDLAGVRRYAGAQPLPDVLVYLTVNSDIAMERALARERALPQRFDALEPERLRAMFANTAQAFDVFVSEIRSVASQPVQIIVIRTEDLAEAGRELAARIDAVLDIDRRHLQPAWPQRSASLRRAS